MESLKVSKIEKLKNILIVVLVLTTILLLYFLWGSESLQSFIFNDEQDNYEVLSTEKVIMPNQIILCRGNEDYTVSFLSKEELWNNQILAEFRDFSKEANILVEEITEEQYNTVMKYPSIIAKFEYDIPFSEFCAEYEIKETQGYDNISNLTQIGFSKGSGESAFIYDGGKKKYYRLVGNKEPQIFKQVDAMVAEKGFTTYYTLKTFLGEESKNNTLIPLELPAELIVLPYIKDVEMSQTEMIEVMAQEYFGETFDFVRKVEESNGTTIYMYGYGQKVLIVNAQEGSIEYKEEVKYSNSEPISMFASLDTALAFIGSHGGFETIAGQQIKPYVESVSQIGDKKNGYRFILGFMIGKNKLFYEEQQPIMIEVTNGQVSYFRREFINFDETQTEKESNREAVSAINMLAMNYEYMRTALVKAGVIDKTMEETITFEDIANKIDNLHVGYLKAKPLSEETVKKETGGELLPVWAVEIKGFLLYFDLYDGEPKGYSKAY